MRFVVALLALALASWDAALAFPSRSQTTSPRPVVASGSQKPPTTSSLEFLLTTAAKDFQVHRPPVAERFRNVYFGHVVTNNGAKRFLLCGEFLPQHREGKAEWSLFTTIQTSGTGYEQWLGGAATNFCQASQFVRDNTEDLSAALQKRLDALR